MTEEKEASENTWCFGCGKDNPAGLHLHMEYTDDWCMAVFVPQRQHESYGGRMHGGLITTLLDEVMGNQVLHVLGKPAYTAKLEIRFRRAVLIGRPVTAVGKMVSQRGRLVVTEGRVTDADGEIIAEATAKMMLEQ